MGARRQQPEDTLTSEVPIVPDALAERVNEELRGPAPAKVGSVAPTQQAGPSPPFITLGATRAALPELDDNTVPRSWGGPTSPSSPASRRAPPSSTKCRSLEELYSLVPEIGEKGRLRVERTEPTFVPDQAGGKLRVSGTLGYIASPISTEEFFRKFGGYKYEIFAMVETEPKDNRGGPPQETVRAIAEIASPLHPNLEFFPIAESITEANPMQPYYRFSPGQSGPIVIQQPQQQPMQQPGVPIDPVLRFASEAMQQSRAQQPGQDQNMVRDLTQQSMSMLERQLAERENEVRELREKVTELANRPNPESNTLSAMASVIAAMKGSASSEEMRQLRDQMDSQIDRMRTDHEKDIERMRNEHSRDMDRARKDLEMEERRSRERESDLRASAEKQERSTREDFDRRLREKDESFERRERDMKADQDRALARVKESYESRIADMDRAHQSEARLLEMSSNSLSQTKDITASTRIETLQQQLTEIKAERTVAQERLRALEAEANKPFMDRFMELKQLAEATGIAGGAEAQPPSENSTPTERLLGQLIQNVGPRLPQLLGQVAAVATGKTVPQEGQAAPQQVQTRIVQQQPNPPRQRLMFADADGAPVEDVQRRQQVVLEPPPQVYRQPMEPPQQPVQQAQPTPQQQPQQAQQPAPQQQAQPVQEHPWEGFQWTNLDPETLQGVFGLIAKGLHTGQQPAEVVEQLEAKFSQPIVAAIPGLASVDRVIASIRKAPTTRQSNLASPEGRRYVRLVWQVIAARAAQAAPKEGTPT